MRKQLLIWVVVGCLLISFSALGAAKQVEITILHTNDIRGRVEAAKKPGMGLPKIASLVDKAKQEADHVLVVDAGNAFHGQPIANLVKGKSIARIYEAVGYDVVVPGVHDFHYGYRQLMKLNQKTDFPLIAANITKEANNRAYPFIPGEIKKIAGVKVAFIGLTTPAATTKLHPGKIAGLKFHNPVKAVQKWVELVKEKENPEVIIGLSHLGLNKESKYTSADIAKQVPGIDLIIEGRGHQVLGKGQMVNQTPIVMAGDRNLGVVNLRIKNGSLTAGKGHLISKQEAAEVKPDKEVNKLIRKIKADQKEIMNQVVGTTPVKLNGAREDIRTKETNLGNLVADAMLNAVKADVALTNSGVIRGSIAAGKVTKGDLINVLPFGNQVVVKKMTGWTLMKSIEHGLSEYPAKEGLFPQVSGMSFVFSPERKSGDRGIELQIQGELVDPDKHYRVATNGLIATGGYDYKMLQETKTVQQSEKMAQVVADYIEQKEQVKPERTGRMIPVVKSGDHYLYTIQWGDTLSELALWFGVEMKRLVEYNNIENPDLIYAGNELKLPAAK